MDNYQCGDIEAIAMLRDLTERPFAVEPMSYAAGCAFIDDDYVSLRDAKLPLMDWGFTRGDACQDTISVRGGNFFRLHDHVVRFEDSCRTLRYACPFTREQIVSVMRECVRRTGLTEATVQIIMTRGAGPTGSRDPRECRHRFMAYCVPFITVAKAEQLAQGLSVHISNRWRLPSETVPSEIKNYHWIDFTLALFDAYEHDCDSALLLGKHGLITEGPGFNVFALFDDRLVTPGENVLAGITRRTVFELCVELGIRHREGPLLPEDLARASEIFASTTAGGLVPIVRIDETTIGDGGPGPLTSRLRDLYWRKRDAGWYATPVYEELENGE
ncbi:aminotransferase class IV [Paraburkholderia sp.]|uniref:aminotransferase class IV n=1 Tax=Paraburkholderia sp. TaxID=1926495 RepID=UPI0039E5CED6